MTHVQRTAVPRWFGLLLGILGAVLAFANPLAAQTPVFSAATEQWGVEEIALRSAHDYNNPFTEVTLRCRFHSGTTEVTADGFYDGDRTWRVRLMPEVQGHWTFETISNDAELNGKKGSFEVGKPGPNNHGPIRVADKYHFAYEDGAPFFVLGTTFYDWLHHDTRVELRTLSTLSHTSFNKVRFMVFPFGPTESSHFPFPQTSAGKFDLDRFQPEFFQRYETGIRELQSLGIEADVILFHPYDRRSGFMEMGLAHDQAYIRYIVARFAAYRNVWWTLTNEFDLYPVQKDWKQLGELLEASDPYKHLRGIHNCCTAFYDNSQSWITHVILQDITLQRLTETPRNNSWLELDARKIGKPVVTDEYGYEGNLGFTWGSMAPREIVEMHWSITMAGAYGSHGESYNFVPNGDFIGDAPARLGFLKQIMSEAPYREMEPATDIVKDGGTQITVLAKRGSYYLIHFGQPKEIASWNWGFFGPATPSNPQPLSANRSPIAISMPPNPAFNIGEGTFRVDLIDTWNMKVYPLGYTTGPVQEFRSRLEPGVLRLVKVDHVPDNAPTGTVSDLMNRYEPH
jgi:hypothetical protein